MKIVAFLQRLFCLLAMLGIILGPVSVGMAESAMASSGNMAMPMGDVGDVTKLGGTLVELGEMHMSATSEGMAVSTDMPCCPKIKPAAPGCQKACPLALVCSSMILVHPDHSSAERTEVPRTLSFAFLHDADLNSTEVEPPARPPRP